MGYAKACMGAWLVQHIRRGGHTNSHCIEHAQHMLCIIITWFGHAQHVLCIIITWYDHAQHVLCIIIIWYGHAQHVLCIIIPWHNHAYHNFFNACLSYIPTGIKKINKFNFYKTKNLRNAQGYAHCTWNKNSVFIWIMR